MKCFDDVLKRLDEIIGCELRINSQKSIFAALYRQTSKRIQVAAEQGFFNDPVLMENFDVIFAKYYFDNYEKFLSQTECASRIWEFTFKTSVK